MAHGKSTVVKAISGVQTVRFKNELERNITIKLGYANAKIYKAKDARVPRWPLGLGVCARADCQSLWLTRGCRQCRPAAYKAYGSSKEDTPACDYPGFDSTDMELVRHVSFVDCPGGEADPLCHLRLRAVAMPPACRRRADNACNVQATTSSWRPCSTAPR